MSEITLGRLIYETEAHYHRYTPRWDNCAHDVKAAFEAAGAKVQERVRAEHASEIERLREALKPLAKSFEEQIKDPELKRLDFYVNIRVNLTIEQGLLALAALSTPKESLPVEGVSR